MRTTYAAPAVTAYGDVVLNTLGPKPISGNEANGKQTSVGSNLSFGL